MVISWDSFGGEWCISKKDTGGTEKRKVKPIVLIYLSLSFIPIFYWKYLVFYSGITSITQHVIDLNLVWERLFEFYTHFKILELLFYSKNYLLYKK